MTAPGKIALCCLALCCCAVAAPAADSAAPAPGPNLLANGDFSALGDNGYPAHWAKPSDFASYGISWDVWLKGGPVTEKRKPAPGVAQESTEMDDVTFESPGTQKLVDAIRAAGAGNILIVGALDYSYDLSGILKGYEVKESEGGRGIVYSSHVYPWKRDWQGKFLDVEAKHPVFIGECGAPDKAMPFQNPRNFPEPRAWSRDFLGMIRKYKIHWTGWCFHPNADPKMLADWRYTPTPYWGAYAKRALAGETFPFNGLK